jgi:SAM-dependent methyltransferase
MKLSSNSYIPALGYRWLTRFYDPVVRATTREATFKDALLQQASIQDGQRILDLGCGTGTLAMMAKRANRSAAVFGLDERNWKRPGSRSNWIKDVHRPCRIGLNRSTEFSQVCFFIICPQNLRWKPCEKFCVFYAQAENSISLIGESQRVLL